jgi:hypothetical protein
MAVIVSADSPTRDLPLSTIRRVFLGYEADDASGRRFIPFNHPPRAPIRAAFDREVLDMTPDQVGRYWMDSLIRGQGGAPRTVPNTELLFKVVAKVPGAISYAELSRVSGGVTAVRVNGKAPGQLGYPIR